MNKLRGGVLRGRLQQMHQPFNVNVCLSVMHAQHVQPGVTPTEASVKASQVAVFHCFYFLSFLLTIYIAAPLLLFAVSSYYFHVCYIRRYVFVKMSLRHILKAKNLIRTRFLFATLELSV